ncbi:MAG: adenylate kinase [Archaeoglobi archaeon]|nr:adenylate kinase family protein [Candidatus Mnemosynella bozhongmuii]MDI3502162.1 adenylate kinase [Archaeoglobi archaeon]MDK2781156.1 adenylate kinase [Archaeoglobi archaeon]
MIGITGTPGTGKSTAAEILRKKGWRVLNLNEYIEKKGLFEDFDELRESWVVDEEKLREHFLSIGEEGKNLIVEGHLSHFLPCEKVIVLRAHPKELERRLRKKGYDERKIRENIEAEALDVILVEALENCEEVHEIDTTSKTPEEVAELIEEIIRGRVALPPGKIDWSEEVF